MQPRVAGTIQADYRDWPDIMGVQLEGEVRCISGREQAAALARYGLKFPVVGDLAGAPATVVRAMSRIAWYKITPDRLYLIDNSLGFGHRDEVPL